MEIAPLCCLSIFFSDSCAKQQPIIDFCLFSSPSLLYGKGTLYNSFFLYNNTYLFLLGTLQQSLFSSRYLLGHYYPHDGEMDVVRNLHFHHRRLLLLLQQLSSSSDAARDHHQE